MEGANLHRSLGTFDSIMMMVGIVIGSGIFLTTGIMAESLPSAPLIMLAWAIGGMLTLAGALTFAELGAAMPEAGGPYVYLREAYGPVWGFLFGWNLFLVSMGGAVAALAVGLAEYLGYFFPWVSTENVALSLPGGVFEISTLQLVALAAILGLSAVHYVGVGYAKGIQNVATVLKIGTLVAFIALGPTIGQGMGFDTSLNPGDLDPGGLLTGVGVALIAVFWAFDGWHNVTYIAGEIREPGKRLPITLVSGTVLITGLYLLVNWVYLSALPVSELAGQVRVAETTATALFGPTGARLISAAVIVSIFGALNGAIFVAPRVYFAMARDGLFFQTIGRVHPRFGTPAMAIVAQAGWAGLLALTGSFEQLFTYVMFLTLFFWVAATSAVFRLRRKRPDMPRPYRTWGYPVVPVIFVVMISGILINTLFTRPVQSLAGIGIAALGLPVYVYWQRWAGGSSAAPPDEAG